jgi:C4-dicarboxylate transporter
LLLLATYVPTLAQILSLAPPDANGWLLILGFSLVPLAVGQGIIEWRRNLSKR